MYGSKNRQIKLRETKELLRKHAEEITSDAQHWMNFLDTASRLYRYQFSAIVLIHAQKPEAMAVASYDIWSKNMHRYIKRGTKGIALIDDLWGEPQIRYVYDITDTGITRLSRSPATWEITDAMEEDMRGHMVETYGLDADIADTFERSLYFVSFRACEGKGKEIAEVMRNRAAQSENTQLVLNASGLEEKSELLMVNSLIYMLLRRCGVDPMRVLSEDDFTPWLTGIENIEMLDAVGDAIMEQAGPILHDIYRASVRIARERVKKSIDSINKMSYTSDNMNIRSLGSRNTNNKTAKISDNSHSEHMRANEHNGNGGEENGYSVHSEGRVPVSESDSVTGSGREGGDRQIRDNAYGISSDTSPGDISEPPVHGRYPEALRSSERRSDGENGLPYEGTDAALQRSGAGSGDGSLELHGMEGQHREDGGGDRPGGLSVHIVEDISESEDDGLTPEEPDEIPPGLTLPEIPSMADQIRELQKLEKASYAEEAGVPVEVIDEFLRCGGPEDRSNLRIIYNFMISQTDEEYADFLYREFAGYSQGTFSGYRGLTVDGVPYTEEWNEGGLTFAIGKSMEGMGRTSLSWQEASKRIEQLLLAGQYAPQVVLDAARENAVRENADMLRLYYIDISLETRELFTHVDRGVFQGSEPDYTEKLRAELVKPEFLRNLQIDLQAIQRFAEENAYSIWGGGHRWKFWQTRPERVCLLIDKFQKPAIPYQEDQGFNKWKYTTSFIPQEVLDGELRRGGMTRNGNYRILSFFLSHKDKKERAEFLKNQYGTGGHSGPDFYHVDFDAKGLKIRIGFSSEGEMICTWPKAEARITALMDQGTYLSEDEFNKLASYELNTMAERVATFYLRLPDDISAEFKPAKTGNYAWEMQSAEDAVKSMGYADTLTDAERGEALYQDMLRAFAALPSGNWNYNNAEQLVQNIRLYLDGKYTLFPGLERVTSTDAIPSETHSNRAEEADITNAIAEIVDEINSQTGRTFDSNTAVKAVLQIKDTAMSSDALKISARNNTAEDFEYSYFSYIDDALIEDLPQNQEFFGILLNNEEHKKHVFRFFVGEIYNSLREESEKLEDENIELESDDSREIANQAETVSLERKNALAPEERDERETDSKRESFVSESEKPSASGDTGAAEQSDNLEPSSAFVTQRDKLEKKSRRAPRRKKKDQTDVLKKFHGFPDSVSDGQGQQMSLFDFMSVDGSGFDAMKFTLEEQPSAEESQNLSDNLNPSEEVLVEESFDMPAIDEDLSFIAGLTPGETAFLLAGTHYLIHEINFTDRIVSAQDMDFAASAGSQIYQTFTFHEIRAILEQRQNPEQEIIENEETTETEEVEEPEEITPETVNGVEIVARFQSTAAMQDGYVENIVILQYPNGKFYNHYNYDDERGMGAASAGPFESLEDARQTVMAHRPDAVGIDISEIIQPEADESEPVVSDYSGEERDLANLEEKLPDDIPGQEAFIQERINYRISDDTLGEGGPKEKFRRNLDAIQTLKQIEAENRLATAEEQEVLAQYVGWGGLSQAFLSSTDVAAGKISTEGAWANEQAQLLEVLTPQEYENARESTLTSFYTPPVVIRAMYQALANFGFTSGNVLEPSCGTGNFMGLVPETMDASMYGVELDSVSGRIARQLYQQNQILVQGFETARYPDNFFDVVIGNVPFGDFSVSDPRYQRNHFSIHEYFIAKSLDLVRPGGIVAVVTSSYTMDKKDPAVRRYIANRADLLDAIRLPNNTFTKNAGTTVVSDILFLQKRDRAVIEEPLWVENPSGEFNPYFQTHKSMVLGRIEEVSTRFGMQETVLPYENRSLENLLGQTISLIEGRIPDVESDETAEMEGVDLSVPANPDVRNYSYTVVNDKIYYREDSRMNPVEVPKNAQGRMKDMIRLNYLVRDLLHAQMEESRDEEIVPLQRQLNEQYDAFVESWGRISSPVNRKAFQKDSSYSLLASLEILDDEGNFDHKADIFSKRTISRAVPVTHVDTASEALAVCIGELARVDLGRMSELTGKTEEEVERELSGVIFRDIVCSENAADIPWAFKSLNKFPVVTADEYLSGNVRSKLHMANAFYQAMEDHITNEEKQRILVNISSLEAVQPEDLKASEIEVRIGTTWLPLEYYNDFLYETFNIAYWERRSIFVEYSEQTGAWFVRGKTRVSRYNSDVYQMYGTYRANGLRLYEDALNLRSTKIYDVVQDEDGKQKRVLNSKQTVLAQQKQELLCEHFKDWIYKTVARRERIEKIYNENFNNTRPREYDGSHITFVGMSPEIQLMEHQKNAVAHILYGKNTLLAHCVGAGKTYEMVAAGMESRRLGLAKKCMYVVPNHLTEQWATEFLTLYPAANILAATKKDFEPANRKRFCSRIATGDYDAIIIGHSQFEKIPLSTERQTSILKKQISDITAAIAAEKEKSGKGDFSIKQMEKTKKTLQTRLDKLNNQSRKDRVVTFEELGVDRLFVDESHNYKNLFLYTKMTNVAGISQTDAQKSSDMFAKCQYLDEITGGRGVVFATGTPISNSAVELYTLMRYLQYGTLEKMGMTNFDSWASTFGETVNAIELAPEGTGYRTKTRFAHFYNLPELTSIFREAADVKTADMLNLPVPEAEYINETVKASEVQKKMVESFGKRADLVRGGSVNPRTDNMLKITNDGRKCALDERLMNDLLPDEEDSKVNRCVANAFEVWQETEVDRSTQLIFCDLSTPKGDGTFNVYDDIRDKLVAKGIPKEEIAFIHEYNTEVKKAELFKKVRSGVVRILMGSTQKMGAGTNVQDRLFALHHLDCPWKPSDLEQQEGRILRQGNRNKKVKIFRYVTEGTFDSYMWQLLENKQKFISQIMTSKCPARAMQDVDDAALTYAEIKMLAAGDSRIKEKMTLDVEVSKLKTAKSNYSSQKYDLETKVAVTYPQTIQALKERIEGLKKDAVEAKKILELEKSDEEGAFQMKIGSNVYTDTKEAGKSLVSRCKQLKGVVGNVNIGTYHGFELYAAFIFGTAFDARLTLRGGTSTEIKLSSDPVGNITRIHNALGKFDERIAESERKLADTQSMLEAAKENLKKPFEFEEEMQTKLARLNELDAELNINKSSSMDAIGVDEDMDTFTAGDGGVLEDEDAECDEHEDPAYGTAGRKISRFGN